MESGRRAGRGLQPMSVCRAQRGQRGLCYGFVLCFACFVFAAAQILNRDREMRGCALPQYLLSLRNTVICPRGSSVSVVV